MKNFKKLILMILLCLPMALQAQVDSKYLEGAVPVVDGKVTFSTSIKARGMTQAQIYETVLKWADKRFQPNENLNPKILYSNPEKSEIIAGGEEYIVFSSNFISLDRTRIYYHLIINCENENCRLTMTRIHYWYEEDIDGGYKYKAETWITDKEALNKAKNKFAKVSGKFRKETIDYKDRLFAEVETALNGQVIARINNETTAVPKAEFVKVEPVVKVVAPEQKVASQEEIIKNATRITLTAGNDEQFEINKEAWGGFGELFGKKVTFCLIDTQKEMGNLLMSQAEDYTISFFNENSNKPCLVIKCVKMGQQELKGKSAKNLNPNCEEGKSYNMYIGAVQK